MGVNHYKIDWNRYSADTYPYALFSRRAWWRRWEHVQSFKSKEEARELFAKLNGLPEYLSSALTAPQQDKP